MITKTIVEDLRRVLTEFNSGSLDEKKAIELDALWEELGEFVLSIEDRLNEFNHATKYPLGSLTEQDQAILDQADWSQVQNLEDVSSPNSVIRQFITRQIQTVRGAGYVNKFRLMINEFGVLTRWYAHDVLVEWDVDVRHTGYTVTVFPAIGGAPAATRSVCYTFSRAAAISYPFFTKQ